MVNTWRDFVSLKPCFLPSQAGAFFQGPRLGLSMMPSQTHPGQHLTKYLDAPWPKLTHKIHRPSIKKDSVFYNRTCREDDVEGGKTEVGDLLLLGGYYYINSGKNRYRPVGSNHWELQMIPQWPTNNMCGYIHQRHPADTTPGGLSHSEMSRAEQTGWLSCVLAIAKSPCWKLGTTASSGLSNCSLGVDTNEDGYLAILLGIFHFTWCWKGAGIL